MADQTTELAATQASTSATAAGDSTQVFRFLDLPSELRNNIYSLLLEADEPIRIRSKKKRHRYHHRIDEISTSILCTNRQINSEATAILYSANKIEFKESTSFLRFLVAIGDRKLDLRHVTIDWIENYVHMRSALHLLKQVKRLQVLELSQNVMYTIVWNGKGAILLPWLRMVKKVNINGGRGSALDILSFTPDFEWPGVNEQFVKDRREAARRTETKLRTWLAEQLGE